MRVTLKQLLAFDTIARFGSISKAAEEMSLSQSAVSLALKDLESAIGFPLFERRKRTLLLNENGRRFQPRARAILRQVDDLETATLDGHLSGTLRIAAGSMTGTYLLPQICAKFVRDYPDVNLKLVVCSSSEVVDRIDAMKQDIGFIESQSHRTSLKLLPWFDDQMVIFCSPRHHLAGKTIAPGDLEAESWFIQPLGSFTRYSMSAAFKRYIRNLRVGMEINSIDGIKRAVMEGGGLGCLSQIAVQTELDSGDLVQVNVPALTPVLQRNISMVLRKDVYHGELIDAFARAVRQSKVDRRVTSGGQRSLEIEKLLQGL